MDDDRRIDFITTVVASITMMAIAAFTSITMTVDLLDECSPSRSWPPRHIRDSGGTNGHERIT